MDLEDLKTYVEIVKQGGISAAARRLSVSQPAVSRRIRKMEDELGVSLLHRTPGMFAPTRAGLELLQFAQQVLSDYESLKRSFRQARSIKGILNISASTTPGEHIVPDLLADFFHLYPEVSASVHVMDSAVVEDCVESGHCEVGFLGRPPRPGILAYLPVGQDEIVLAVPATHRFAREKTIRLEQLHGENMVTRQESSGTHRSVIEILQSHGLALPPHNVVARVNTVATQLSAIGAGQGIGFVSRLALDAAPKATIAMVRLREVVLTRQLYMVYDPVRDDQPLITFVAFVTEFLSNKAY